MTRIDFYTQVADPETFACRLVQTVYAKGQRLQVCLDDDAALSAFSVRLWSFDDVAFVPHCRSDDPHAGETPVWLTCHPFPASAPAVLLNLAAALPEHPERYARILEIVGCDPSSLATARERFRAYRSSGFSVDHHDMSHR
jgi:DNA polymerase-3 subunit chi